jgi:hypothetical protein
MTDTITQRITRELSHHLTAYHHKAWPIVAGETTVLDACYVIEDDGGGDFGEVVQDIHHGRHGDHSTRMGGCCYDVELPAFSTWSA